MCRAYYVPHTEWGVGHRWNSCSQGAYRKAGNMGNYKTACYSVDQNAMEPKKRINPDLGTRESEEAVTAKLRLRE